MYDKILIFSDNIYMCSQFENLIEELGLNEHIHWDFAISPQSNFSNFSNMLKYSVNVLDLKKIDIVERLCANYNLIISIHCKQIFPEKLVNNVKCINVHPGYNPINRGWYPQVFAIINDTEIGATIHEIDEYLDHGPIIDREFVIKNSWDTSLSLYNKILIKEVKLLRKNLSNIISGNYKTLKPERNGDIFLKKDFNKLLKLDLNEVKTLKESLDLLRALSHGEYKNAYYVDEKTNKKVYISLNLEAE